MSAKSRVFRVTIHGAEHMANEPAAREFMFSLISIHSHNADEVVCSVQPRNKHGYLEWLVHLYKSQDSSVPLTVGVIQRSPDGKMESHS